MTDDLSERVAMALGWTFITYPDGPCPEVKHWMKPGSSDQFHWRPTPFASDPATIPEMADFLRSGGAEWAVFSTGFGFIACWRSAASSGKSSVMLGEDMGDIDVEEDTLNLALARLVCAVAEAKKQ